MISTDGGMGRKWLIGCWRKERYENDGKVVEVEKNISKDIKKKNYMKD